MKKVVTVDKMSKKERKKFYAEQRRTWQGMNPVTRSQENGKAYNRNRRKQEDRRSSRMTYDDGQPAVFVYNGWVQTGTVPKCARWDKRGLSLNVPDGTNGDCP